MVFSRAFAIDKTLKQIYFRTLIIVNEAIVNVLRYWLRNDRVLSR